MDAGHWTDLFPHADVALPDEDPCMVDRLGQSKLEHLSLQPPLHEVLRLEGEHVIELHFVLCQHSDPDQTTQQRIALEQALGILLLEREKFPGGGADLGQGKLNSPNLQNSQTSVSQTQTGGKPQSSPLSCSSVRTRPPASVLGLAEPFRRAGGVWCMFCHTSWGCSD